MGPSEVVSCGSLGAPPHVGIPSNVHSVACIQLLAPCWNGGGDMDVKAFYWGEWYGSSRGMGIPILGGPWNFP